MHAVHRDSFVAGLKCLPGARFADDKDSGQLVGWRAFTEKAAEMSGHTAGAAAASAYLDTTALADASTPAELRTAVLQAIPEYPEVFFDQVAVNRIGQKIRARLTSDEAGTSAAASAVPPILAGIWTQFWNCTVAGIGFWTAVAVIAVLAAIAFMVVVSGMTLLAALVAAAYEITGPYLITIALTAVFCAMDATFEYRG